MRILIEEYRGWEIFFDTDKEEFYTVSNEYDTDNTKKSFSSTKKYIDDFIKENNSFKPIFVQKERTTYDNANIIKLIAIRKDGDFMYENDKGQKKRLSSYEEKNYFLVNSENDVYFEQIEEIEKEREKLLSKINELRSKLIKVTVEEIKQKLLK